MASRSKVEMKIVAVSMILNSWCKTIIKRLWLPRQQAVIIGEREVHLVPIARHLQKVEAVQINSRRIQSRRIRPKTEEPCWRRYVRRTRQAQWLGTYSLLTVLTFKVIKKNKVCWMSEWSPPTYRITKVSPWASLEPTINLPYRTTINPGVANLTNKWARGRKDSMTKTKDSSRRIQTYWARTMTTMNRSEKALLQHSWTRRKQLRSSNSLWARGTNSIKCSRPLQQMEPRVPRKNQIR